MIVLKNVSKSYNRGKVLAVNDLSLQVKNGELFGFLGPNGAGKTTTIKSIVGLLKPDNGTIQVCGIDILKQPIKAKSMIGYVPDEPVLYQKMIGIKFLNFICNVFKVEKKERENIKQLAEEFEMKEYLGQVISTYSHGMKQKLTIIAALLHNPQLVILDEPIVGLDPKAAFTLKEKLKQLCKEGKTVFFSTHVMEIAEKLCDRVGIINQGSMLAAAPLNELKSMTGKKRASLEQIFLELTR
jgi:ABC-2 type transport system ATP-binding protein